MRFRYCGKLALIAVVLSVPLSLAATEGARPADCFTRSYTTNSTELYTQIEAFLEITPDYGDFEEINAVLVPYDPYIYTGSVISCAYSALSSADYDRIILLGPDESAESMKLYSGAKLETPLGALPSDDRFAETICERLPERCKIAPAGECVPISIASQLPFLQFIYGERPVLALGVGSVPKEEAAELGRIIASASSDVKTLIIGAANLSRTFDSRRCEAMDYRVISALRNLDVEAMTGDFCAGRMESSCPQVILMLTAMAEELGAESGRVLKYTNSAQVTGDRQSVCGYCSVVMGSGKGFSIREGPTYSAEEGQYLLSLARGVICKSLGLSGCEIPPLRSEMDEKGNPAGVYMTIEVDGDPRGGVSSVFSTRPVSSVVENVALSSAFNDPRYNPITREEFERMKLELYILTGARKVEHPDDYRPFSEGLLINKGSHSAMILPGEIDPNMEPETILGRACLRAGFLSGCWRQSETEVWAFSVRSFEERE